MSGNITRGTGSSGSGNVTDTTGVGAPSTSSTAADAPVADGGGAPDAVRTKRPKSVDIQGLDLQRRLDESLNKKTTTTAGKPLEPDLEPVGASVTDALKGLAPAKFESGDPLQLVKGLKDGKVALEIPMAPGKHKIRGVNVTVKENTVMKVYVEVKDGQLVAARNEKGKDTGGGCKIEIDPPLDLPVVSGKGLYLKEGKGDAPDRLKADIGGFFDLKLKETKTLELDDLVNGLAQKKLGVEGDDKDAGDKKGALPLGLLQMDKLTFDVKDVTLTDGVIDTGTMKIDLAPGSKLAMSGSLKEASLKGDIKLDALTMNQGGMLVEVGAGSASFEAKYVKNADGTMAANTRISSFAATVDRLETGTPPDHLKLGKTTVSNGTIEAHVKLAPQAGSPRPQIVGIATSAWLDAEGTIESARLTVKDGKDDATISLGASGFKGKIASDAHGTQVDAKLTGAKLEVTDLQSHAAPGKASLDLGHAKLEGDATIKVNTSAKQFDVTVDAKSLDIHVNDYKGTKDGTVVDLAGTDLTGTGTVRLTKGEGIEIDGAMKLKGGFDDLKVVAGDGKATVDVASGSTVELDVTHFVAGKGKKGLELDAKGKVSVGLDGYDVNLPGVTATGTASVKGTSDVKIRPGEFLMVNTDATISVKVDDAKVAPGGKGFSLDVAKGSSLDLNVVGSTISSDASLTLVKLGKGSKLDAVLDSGEVTVEGQTIKLEKGSKARFDITSLTAPGGGGTPSLKGKLSVDAKISGASVDLQDLPNNADVRVQLGDAGKGTAKLSIDDVTLSQNGSFTLTGVNAGLHAKVDKITGATSKEGVGIGTLSAEQVKGMSATAIAGAKGPAETPPVKPIDLAKQLKSGTFEVEVPIEGTVGDSYLKSATFPKGTKVRIAVEVKDGKIDPKKTKATISQPGDGALWVTVHGAYFDEDNTMRLALGGMKDFAVPNMEDMPLEIGAFVDRLTAPKPGKTGGGGADKLAALKLDQMRFEVKNATIQGGKIPIPGGYVDASSDTKISISGTPQAATVQAHLALNGMQLDQDGIALKTGKGRADLKLEYKMQGDKATVATTLSNMSLDVQYAVQKRENGDYIHLASGSVQGASMMVVATAPVGPGGKLGKPVPGKANLALPVFKGTIAGGRVTVKDKDGTAQLELGSSSVEGSIRVDKDKIALDGRVTKLDVGVRSFAGGAKSGKVSADVDYARLQGTGTFQFSTDGGFKVDANVKDVELDAKKVQGTFKKKP